MAADDDDSRRLQALVEAGHACISVETFEEDEAGQLVAHVAAELGRPLYGWSVSRGVHDALVAGTGGVENSEHAAAALFHLGLNNAPCLTVMYDLAPHLKDERTLRHLRDLVERYRKLGSTLVLVDHAELPAVVKAIATPFELSLPDEAALDRIVREAVRMRNDSGRRVQVELSRKDLGIIVRNLLGLTRRQARQMILDVICDDSRLDAKDINHILANKRTHLKSAGLLEYIEAPVDLAEIGGLGHLKQWLERRREALGDEAAKFGIPAPRGVLMLGVQGAGKSLSAKAVATAWQRPLMRLDPGVLFDRYIGESEKRLRDALQQAEMMAPMILWIDEIEKGFASAASQSTDGGLAKRMFGTLLTWMQEHRSPVFLIATANDIEALPPELLRKGRFDEIFFVDLPTLEGRARIFEIHLKKRGRSPGAFDVHALADASEGFSGAEIEQAVVSALHDAFAARSELTTAGVLAALRASPPLSVTMREKIANLRRWAEGRCVAAG